jgi:ElaB/YqjD/DUF883 family membrane-anchored ribosome-binding protein
MHDDDELKRSKAKLDELRRRLGEFMAESPENAQGARREMRKQIEPMLESVIEDMHRDSATLKAKFIDRDVSEFDYKDLERLQWYFTMFTLLVDSLHWKDE